jgi:hypothetical protein
VKDIITNKLFSFFDPVSLEQINDVALMNRMESKYVFSSARIPVLLDKLAGRYKVLEIDNIRCFAYKTIYLDSASLFFFEEQMRGRLGRHKVRYREYVSTHTSFLEVKKKTNKGRTIKWRIQNDFSEVPDDKGSSFLNDHIKNGVADLIPVLENEFLRITFAGIDEMDRITLDFNLSFSLPGNEKNNLPYIAIAEVKQDGHSHGSVFSGIMKEEGIRQGGFSKYCIGSALVREVPRKNLLKPDLRLINKLQNEYITFS